MAAAAPVPALAAAEPVTAEQAIENQRKGVRQAVGVCDRTAEDQILVCGSRGGAGRDVFPDEPGQRQRLVAGEARSASGAVNLGTCCAPRGGLNVIHMGQALAKGLGKIF
jgi:hypothetical protein